MDASATALGYGNAHHLREELRLAGEFQRAVLPCIPDTGYLDAFTHYAPRGSVSGDMYDFVMNRAGDLAVFVGDATGHGVVSAFITMMVHLALASIRPDLATDEVMRRLNALLAGRTAANSVTGVFFRVTADGRMTATHAGHPPLLVVSPRRREVIAFREGGCPLGMFADERVRYIEESRQLHPGDKIVAYTDGVTEWRRRGGEGFGPERLGRILREHGEASAGALGRTVVERLHRFSGGNACGDDCTLVCLEYK